MTFWDFASKDFLAVLVLLWFLWCLYDKGLDTWLASRQPHVIEHCCACDCHENDGEVEAKTDDKELPKP